MVSELGLRWEAGRFVVFALGSTFWDRCGPNSRKSAGRIKRSAFGQLKAWELKMRVIPYRDPITAPFQSFGLPCIPDLYPGGVWGVPVWLLCDEWADVDCKAEVVVALPATGVCDSSSGLCSSLGVESILFGVGTESLNYFDRNSLS